MNDRVILAVLLLLILGLIFVWSLCMAIKTDLEEAKRDALSADPTADPFHLREPRD